MRSLLRACRQIFKFTIFCGIVVSYLIQATLIRFFSRDLYERRALLSRLVQSKSTWTLILLGVHVSPDYRNALKVGNHFIVSNHMSYIDVLIIASMIPCSFVTSMEMKNAPFLGLLTELAGCLYVERRSRENLENEISDITDALKAGLNVCIFPEATSTNGDQVLRFRRPLYSAAVDSSTRILPMSLNYESIDGDLVSPQNRDTVCWYGDMDFLPHLWNLMGHRRIDATLHIHAHIETAEYSCTRTLSERSHEIVVSLFRPLATSL